MELDAFRERSEHDRAFKEACDKLWEDYVRPDLIFGRKLLLCRPCQAFFYQGDTAADHPKEHVILAQRFMGENGITSPAKLVQFFKGDLSLTTDSGIKPDHIPTFSSKHVGAWLAKPSPAGGPEEQTKWHRNRALEVERELAQATARIGDLETEIQQMKKDNDDLMHELLRVRVTKSQERRAVNRLATSIMAICSDDPTKLKN